MIYAAALIIALVGPVHSYLGARFLLGPLFRLKPEGVLAVPRARRLFRGAWHLMSLACVTIGWLLVLTVGSPIERHAVVATLALTAISAVVCLVCAGPKHPGAIAFSVSSALLVASWF